MNASYDASLRRFARTDKFLKSGVGIGIDLVCFVV